MNYNAWLGTGSDAITDINRAASAWNRITQKPSTIAFRKRDNTTLSSQTVRVEYDSTASESQSEAGNAPVRQLTIFGIKGHDSETDTDMGEGYRFVYGGDEYTIVDTIETIGEIQARAEAVG